MWSVCGLILKNSSFTARARYTLQVYMATLLSTRQVCATRAWGSLEDVRAAREGRFGRNFVER